MVANEKRRAAQEHPQNQSEQRPGFDPTRQCFAQRLRGGEGIFEAIVEQRIEQGLFAGGRVRTRASQPVAQAEHGGRSLFRLRRVRSGKLEVSAVELDAESRTSGIEARLGSFGDAVHDELRRARVDHADWVQVERGEIGHRVGLHIASCGHEKAGGGECKAARIERDERGRRERVATAEVAEAEA